MKDMGKLPYCLGVSIEQDEEHKCQRQYILNMLEKYGLTNAKIVSTPAYLSVRLARDDDVGKTVDQINQWLKFAVCCYGYTSRHCSSSGSSVKIKC